MRTCLQRAGAIAAALLLTCASPGPAEDTDARTLRVRGDHNYPPYEFLQDGQPTGFNVELMRAVCRVMGLPVQIELGPWRDVRAQLEAGSIDALCGMAYSPERDRTVDFCAPHSVLSFDVFVRTSSSIHAIEQLRDKLVVVQEGGRMHDLVQAMNPAPRVATLRDVPQIVRSLAAGRYDAALLNRAQALYFTRELHITNLRGIEARLEVQPYGFAVPEGRTDLVLRFNEGLNVVKATGEYQRLRDRWLSVYEQRPLPTSLRYLLLAAGVALLLLSMSFAWSWSLRRLVHARTRELRQTIDLVPHMIFAKDQEGRFILANRAFAQAHDRELQSIVGRRQLDLETDNVQDVLRQLKDDREVIDSGQPKFIPEERFRTARGEARIVQTTKIPFRPAQSPLPAVLGISVDITDLKRAEEALRESEENLAITLNSIGEAVIATDAQGRITRMNPVAEVLTGWRWGDVRNRPLGEIVLLRRSEPDQGQENPVSDILEGRSGSGVSHQFMLMARRGTERLVTTTCAPIRDREQAVVGVVLIIRDVTEDRRVEDRLREAEKMESVGRLAGGIAHDFNNILGGIMGFAELIAMPDTDAAETRGHARSILGASERARDMIQKLLAYSRRSPRRILTVNLHQIVADVTGLLRHTLDKRINIVLKLDAARAMVQGDPTQLQSALMNLAVNARDAMPRGGALTFSTYDTVLKEDFCAAHGGRVGPGPYVVLAVMDTGVGMDAQVLEHLFEPFFTTKDAGAGTGLGLAAVQGTVNDHGGLVTVDSKPDEGTVFRLYLPLSDEDEEIPAAASAPAMGGSGTVLLVDDEEVILNATGRMLTDLGYEVLTAGSGQVAVDLLRQRNGAIDLVILDMVMPGMDGAQTLAAMQEIKPDLRVVLSSGFMRGYEAEDLLAKGVLDFLQKPYRRAQLSEKVAMALARG